MQRNEERQAARDVTEAVVRTIHRLRCRMPSANLLALESFSEAVSLPGASSAGLVAANTDAFCGPCAT